MNLDIIEYDGENFQVLWRLNNEDGVCYLDTENRVISTELCGGPFDMKPDALKQVRDEVQQWVDDKPERDREYKQREEKDAYYTELWDEWVENNEVKHAFPSVYEKPDDVVADGIYRFTHRLFGSVYTSDVYYSSPTRGDAMLEFDKAIVHTGDYHHSFLEGFEIEGDEIHFLTGS